MPTSFLLVACQYVYKHYRVFFAISFLVMAIIAMMMVADEKKLTNLVAPQSIVSLELARTSARANKIIHSWQIDTTAAFTAADFECNCQPDFFDYRVKPGIREDKVALAIKDTGHDFFFIPAYVFFTIVVIIGLFGLYAHQKRVVLNLGRTVLFSGFAILMGLSDVVENIGMLGYLHGKPGLPASCYSVFAYLKFSILFFFLLVFVPVLLYVTGQWQRFSAYINHKALQVWQYRVILLGLTLWFVPIWLLDQGQDLLVNVNTSNTSVVLFLVTTTLFALFNWYLTKLFFDRRSIPHQCLLPLTIPPVPPHIQQQEKKVSRFIGVCTFLLPAFAILHALQVFKIHYLFTFLPVMLFLGITMAGFYFLIKSNQLELQLGPRPGLSYLLILLSALAVPFLNLWIAGERRDTPLSLVFVAIDLISLAIAFLLFVSVRDVSRPLRKILLLKDKIGFPIVSISGVLIFFFLLANVRPFIFSNSSLFPFVTLPLLISGIMLYTLGFAILIRLGIKKKVYFATFLLAGSLVIAIVIKNEYHQTRMMPHDASYRASAYSDSLDVYIVKWLLSREKEIAACDSGHPYPIFLVNAYGGGVRSAAFTSMSIGYLDEKVRKMAPAAFQDTEINFQHFVFSYSGISGGTAGAAVLCSYQAQGGHPGNDTIMERMHTFYKQDFLTPVVAAFLGRDVWASTSSLALWPDRGALLECLWEDNARKYLHCDYDNDYYSYWDTTSSSRKRYEVPLLFSNTFNVETGKRAILAPVKLAANDFPGILFIRDYLDQDTVTVRMSTAAFLSARFPYITPTAKFGDTAHYLDGGLKDYSGAKTSFQISNVIRKVLNDTVAYPGLRTFRSRIKLYILSLHAASRSRTEPDQTVKNLFEWSAAPIGLINNPDGNTGEDEQININHFQKDGAYFQVWADVDCIADKPGLKPYSPVLPLGWQISNSSLLRIDSSIRHRYEKEQHPPYDTVLSVFSRYFK